MGTVELDNYILNFSKERFLFHVLGSIETMQQLRRASHSQQQVKLQVWTTFLQTGSARQSGIVYSSYYLEIS